MKKMVAFVLMALMMLGAIASAEDLGVQMIGGSSFVAETVNLDDMKLEQVYKIEGYAKIEPLAWKFDDFFYQYVKDHAGDNSHGGEKGKNPWAEMGGWYYKWINIMNSGTSAEFAWLEVDVTNLAKTDVDFTQQVEVKVVYDDDYEFAGWVRMINYDYDTYDGNGALVRTTLNPDNSESIDMMYTAHLVFGATLPNAVVEDKAPLRMEIKLGENELTYHIRK